MRLSLKEMIPEEWVLPIRISVGFHVVAVMFVGYLTYGMMEYHAPKEDLIEIDMSMVEPQRARAEVPQLPTKAPAPKAEPIQPKAASTPQAAPKAAPAQAAVSSVPTTADGWMKSSGTSSASSSAPSTSGTVVGASTGVPSGEAVGGETEGNAIGRFLARVESRKEYPFMAVRRNLTGVVTVGVAIDKNGNLIELYVVRSSGAKILDEAGLKAVQKSCPFPHDVGRMLRMNIPISFYLK